uniref:diacylglycerol O-acyltransferase n=1 Tax=Tanacetum cinerariifolium TaxID=118510 RepID=A0A6L2LJ69_TANCI|nr:diacylglycerol acyltransferase 1 [Tanacetum cinerariifolium]
MFYCFFHLWLNILAELLRFGDREFYKDWWNAQTVEEYWRLWNMPVHKWIVRHLYFPCLPLYRCSMPHFQVLGIYRDHVPGSAGLNNKLLAEQVPKLDGGKYNLLVLL